MLDIFLYMMGLMRNEFNSHLLIWILARYLGLVIHKLLVFKILIKPSRYLSQNGISKKLSKMRKASQFCIRPPINTLSVPGLRGVEG